MSNHFCPQTKELSLVVVIEKIVLVFILSTFFSCKKPNNSNPSPQPQKNIVFNNITDLRLAQIVTDENKKITFYGLKDNNGKPILFTGYTIRDLNDTLNGGTVTFDSLGRYQDITLFRGEKLHFEYTNDNQMLIGTVSNNDTLNVLRLKLQNAPKGHRISNQNTIATNSKDFKVEGIEKFNVKVVAKDAFGTENNVNDAQVIARMVGQNFDYSLLGAPIGNGLYSFPIPGDLQINSSDYKKSVIDFISNSLSIACFSTCDGCPSFTTTLENYCVVPTPWAQVLCAAASLTILCDYGIDKIIDKLNESELFDDYSVSKDAVVIFYSHHFVYGEGGSPSVTMSYINSIFNQSLGYISKITYIDNSIAGNWTLNYNWNGQGTASTQINFYRDNTLLIPSFNITGQWYQQENKITFSLSNDHQYRGLRSSSKLMSGTMVAGNGDHGTWSANR